MRDGATANSSPQTATGHKQDDQIVKTKPPQEAARGFWIRAWGQREPTKRATSRLSSPARWGEAAQGWTGHPSHSCAFELSLHRTPAPDVDALCLVTRYASRNAAFGPIDSPLSKGRRTWFISASNKTLATVPFPAGMIGRSLRPQIRVQHERSGVVTAGDQFRRPLGLSC
jgi:hypothetical protein